MARKRIALLPTQQQENLQMYIGELECIMRDHYVAEGFGPQDIQRMLRPYHRRTVDAALFTSPDYQGYLVARFGARDELVANSANQFLLEDEKEMAYRRQPRGLVIAYFRAIANWSVDKQYWKKRLTNLIHDGFIDPDRIITLQQKLEMIEHKA